MIRLAAKMRDRRDRKAADGRQLSSRISVPARSATFTQAEMLVAMARPSTPSQPCDPNQKNRADPSTTVRITEVTAKIIGLRVS